MKIAISLLLISLHISVYSQINDLLYSRNLPLLCLSQTERFDFIQKKLFLKAILVNIIADSKANDSKYIVKIII